jgi:hypothetical protein
MNNSPAIQNYTVVLKSSGEIEPRSLGSYGFIYLYAASGVFEVSFDGVTFIPGYPGLFFNAAGEAFFLRTQSGSQVTVSFTASNFIIGFSPQILPIKAAQTLLKPWQYEAITAGQAVTFYGTGGPGAGQAGAKYLWRKAIVITNNDSSSLLEIKDSTGTYRIGSVQPLKAWYLETSDDLIVKNETLSDINCRIAEIFYPNT